MSSNDPYLVKGAGTDVQPRLEIRKLILQKEQFTLFVLAWNEIRKADYKPAAARYGEQAGIHGIPYKPWLGDPKGQPKSGDDVFAGYCNHMSILFPTWHRPSLMLLEQSISEAANTRAQKFAKDNPAEASKWLDAAHKLRFPYWDWTDPGQDFKFPQIFQDPKVKLTVPKGVIEEHPNPLYSYDLGTPLPTGFADRRRPEFQPGGAQPSRDPIAYFGQWKRTYRWPTRVAQNPTEQIDKLNSYLNQKPDPRTGPSLGSWLNLKQQVSALFLYPENLDESDGVYAWDAFSNTGAASQPSEIDWENPGNTHYWSVAKQLKGKGSIEQPHNLIHLLVGGLGHMMDNDYASFDPIFFLHHCNVDRIYALWEQAYPKYFMGRDGYKDKNGTTQQFKQIWGKFGWKDGTSRPGQPFFSEVPLKGDTPLTPFRKADGSYWTSDDARWGSKIPKNYTYEDIHVTERVLDPLGPKTGLSMKLSLAPHAGLAGTLAQAPLLAVQSTQARAPEAHTPHAENARGCLQKLFGFNPVPARQEAYDVLGESRKLVYPENRKSLNEGYDSIYDYRHFVIRMRLDPNACGMSHLVNVNYNAPDVTGQNTISGLVGSVAVLTRSKESKCGACQGRQEAGVKSVYTIPIPHETIAKVALHSGEMNVVELLTKCLSAEIRLAGDILVANTPTTLPENATPIPNELVPECTLHSAALEARFDGTDHDRTRPQNHAPLTPCETYDWQYHGNLFPSQTWAAV